MSGLTSITIPATVESIGSSFRDCANLETITIEGNTVIGNYAARTCPSLTTVTILGENTTFSGSSMVFTNAENGDASKITVYVANEAVKAAYEAASGSVQNDTVVVMSTADNNEELAAAAATANATVYLTKGTYEFPKIAEGVTIVGEEGVVFEDTLSGTLNNTTFKNVSIKADNAQRWAYAKGDLVFENCTFEATSVYAIHYDGLTDANITYKNCTIIGWVAIGGGAEYITFDGCEIYGNGTYGVLRLYSPGTIKNCTFDVSKVNSEDAYQDGIHAVDCEIKVSNNTNVNGDMSALYNISGTGTIVEE